MAKTRSRPRRARTIPPSTGTIAGGVHQKVVSERLGHASIGTTLGTYSLLIPSHPEPPGGGCQRARRGSTELQQLGKDERLKLANQEIGFHRNMTTACGGRRRGGRVRRCRKGRASRIAWVPIFVAATALFAYRYRRFWRRFGDHVVRGFRTLPPRAG